MLRSFGLLLLNISKSDEYSVIAENENALFARVYSSLKNDNFRITKAFSFSHRTPFSKILKNIHSMPLVMHANSHPVFRQYSLT